MKARDLRLLALDYCAGILENTVGCEYPEEVYAAPNDADVERFEAAIKAIAAGLSKRSLGVRRGPYRQEPPL